MKALWFTIGVVVTLAALACVPRRHLEHWLGARPASIVQEPGDVHVEEFAPCDGAHDAGPGVRRALERARGRTLLVPAGCRLLLRSPGAGRAALTIGSETTIRFLGRSAAFALARRRCVGGRFEGAACHDDAGCRGGTCRCDGGDGPDCPFAPVPEQSYVVLAAEAGSRAVLLDDVRIDVGGLDRFGRCFAGPDAGLPCATVEDCRDKAACLGAGDPPSGPGRIDAIDLARVGSEDDPQVAGAELRGVWLYDHGRGDFSVRTGPGSSITGLNNTLASDGTRRMARWPDVGLDVGSRGQVSAAVVQADRVGVRLASFSTMRDSSVATAADGSENVAGTAVHVAGTQDGVENNQLTGFHCLTIAPSKAANLTFASNRCLYGSGAKIVVNGAGISVVGNYLGWGSGMGGLCAAGPHADLPCHRTRDCGEGGTCDQSGRCSGGERKGARCDCPEATCRPDPVIRLGSGGVVAAARIDHLTLANNLVHSEFETAFIGVPDAGFRCIYGPSNGARCAPANDCGDFVPCDAGTCASGARAGMPCDCPDGSCNPVTIRNTLVVGNNFYAIQPMVGVDLSRLTSGGTRVEGLSVLDNRFSAPGICVALPTDTQLAHGLELAANDFAACTLDPRLATKDSHPHRPAAPEADR